MEAKQGGQTPTLPKPAPVPASAADTPTLVRPGDDTHPAEQGRHPLDDRVLPGDPRAPEFQAARTLIAGEAQQAHVILSGGSRTPATFAPGTRVGPYEVIRELGRGSMGTVLAARHVDLGRDAALKVLAGALVADPDSVERFRRESEAVAQLEHPGIVRLYERGESNGAHFFAMELVPGTSLDHVIRRERVSYTEAARIMAQCAHAIDYAHSRGVLHRDLKPANILLEQSGRTRITDFGLARLDTKATLTSDGVVVGTPLYLAPEVAKGERASRRSDIYSLGASLYELATGKSPYEGRDARNVMMRVVNEAPIPPVDADPRIPRDLVRIIAKAMARDPEERYANARALALDLERFAEGRALELSGGTAAFRETESSRAWRRFLVSGAVLLALAGTFVAIFWLNVLRKQAQEEAHRLARELDKAKKSARGEDPGLALALDHQGLHAAQDRDVRARIALKALGADPAAHRWEERLEHAQELLATDLDEAETECTLCILAPGARREVQLAARLLRARVYRAHGDAVSLWLAATDLKLVVQSQAPEAEGRPTNAADLAFALAVTGELKNAETVLQDAAPVTTDDLARSALARAAIARARKDADGVDSELRRARETATTDETRRLIEAFVR